MESNQRLIMNNKDIGSCDPYPISEPSPLDYPNYKLASTDTEFMLTPVNAGDNKALVIDKQTLKIHQISK